MIDLASILDAIHVYMYASKYVHVHVHVRTQASKLTKEAQRVSKDAARLVPKDVQQAAGRMQKANAEGERARGEKLQNMFNGQ